MNDTVEAYRALALRAKTRRSYAQALRHFEQEGADCCPPSSTPWHAISRRPPRPPPSAPCGCAWRPWPAGTSTGTAVQCG